MNKKQVVLLSMMTVLLFHLILLIPNRNYREEGNNITMKHEKEASLLHLDLNIENYLKVLEFYEIKNTTKVLAQALWETGHFKSYNCRIRNNTLGLYDSKNKKFFSFNHWSESIKLYKEAVEYKLKEGENYYTFLDRIGYAEDPNYIDNIKSMVYRLKVKENIVE